MKFFSFLAPAMLASVVFSSALLPPYVNLSILDMYSLVNLKPSLTVLVPKDPDTGRIFTEELLAYVAALDRIIKADVPAIEIDANDDDEYLEMKDENNFELILKSRPDFLIMPVRRYLSVSICETLKTMFHARSSGKREITAKLIAEKCDFMKMIASKIMFSLEPHMSGLSELEEYETVMNDFAVLSYDSEFDSLLFIEGLECLGYDPLNSSIPLARALSDGKYSTVYRMLVMGAKLNSIMTIKAFFCAPTNNGVTKTYYLQYCTDNRFLDIHASVNGLDLIEIALDSTSQDVIEIIEFLLGKGITLKNFQQYEKVYMSHAAEYSEQTISTFQMLLRNC